MLRRKKCPLFCRQATCSEIFEKIVVLQSHFVRILVARGVLFRIDVEALRVARVADRGDNGPSLPPLQNCVPVDAVNEGMGLDPRGTAAYVAEPPRPVDGAELADQVLGGVANRRVLWEDDGLFYDSTDCERRNQG